MKSFNIFIFDCNRTHTHHTISVHLLIDHYHRLMNFFLITILQDDHEFFSYFLSSILNSFKMKNILINQFINKKKSVFPKISKNRIIRIRILKFDSDGGGYRYRSFGRNDKQKTKTKKY